MADSVSCASAANRPNRTLRTREYLSETEVEKLIDAAKENRYSNMILVACRHEWEQVDIPAAAMHLNRVKNENGSNPAEATPRPAP
jgi:hypothetical protein